ncbi:head-tail adaptor protein [Paenibacillus larvae]|nr:head-tail adaptor protein [Paenibacillus larvae]
MRTLLAVSANLKQKSHTLVMIRYRKDIDRSHVVSYSGRLFDIQHIINVDEANLPVDPSLWRKSNGEHPSVRGTRDGTEDRTI